MWVMLLCNKKNEERIKIENKFLVAWGSSRTKTRGWKISTCQTRGSLWAGMLFYRMGEWFFSFIYFLFIF